VVTRDPVPEETADLEQAFPFFLALDAAGRISRVGRSMRKLVPAAADGVRLDELFLPQAPPVPFDFARLSAMKGQLFIMRVAKSGGIIRGQWQRWGGELVFLGSPWFTSIEELKATGLSLNDFAPHDPTLEALQLLQIQRLISEDLRKLSDRHKAQAKQLELAAQVKYSFITSMSHELRTPLTSVIGLSEAMLTPAVGPLTARQEQFLTKINQSGQHLLGLINDILDFSKLSSGQLGFDCRVIPVEQLGEYAARRVQADVEQRNQRFILVNEAPGAAVWGDAERLIIVLKRLLDNAVKFTANGGELGLRLVVAETKVRFEVWDRGIGMTAEDLANLFQPFRQADAGLARRYQGAGLSLAIAQQVVLGHDGTLEVKSEVGKGTEFAVVLPLVRRD
jgi:signal transduction histidine kinase